MPCGGHARGPHGYPHPRRLCLPVVRAALLAAVAISVDAGHLAAFARGSFVGLRSAASLPASKRGLRAPRQADIEDSAWGFEAILQEQYEEISHLDDLGIGESKFFEPRGFNTQQWRDHASITRFLRDIPGLFFGITTGRVLPIISLCGIFASFVELYSYFAARRAELPEVQLPAAPFEFSAPLLGLLLVFRTNSSYLRFTASSFAVQRITGELTSLVRQLLTWSDGEKQRTSDVDRIIELVVQYHCWLFTCYLVPQDVQPEGRRALAALNERLGRPHNKPLTTALIHTLISWEISQLPHLTVFQRKDMDQCLLVGVTRDLARCEQLLRTPIPLAYTRSLLRFLWLWLTLLPFSLVKTFTDFDKGTWWEGQPLYIVPLVTCFIALLFLSLEDIAVQIEEPFFLQRKQLRRLAEWFKQDAEEMRNTVLHLEATKRQQEA